MLKPVQMELGRKSQQTWYSRYQDSESLSWTPKLFSLTFVKHSTRGWKQNNVYQLHIKLVDHAHVMAIIIYILIMRSLMLWVLTVNINLKTIFSIYSIRIHVQHRLTGDMCHIKRLLVYVQLFLPFLQRGGGVGGPVCKHYVNVNIPGKGKKE